MTEVKRDIEGEDWWRFVLGRKITGLHVGGKNPPSVEFIFDDGSELKFTELSAGAMLIERKVGINRLPHNFC